MDLEVECHGGAPKPFDHNVRRDARSQSEGSRVRQSGDRNSTHMSPLSEHVDDHRLVASLLTAVDRKSTEPIGL